MKMFKVRDKPNMLRDAHSKAIIIQDEQARTNYRNHRSVATNAFRSTEEIRQDVEVLKQDMEEIKHLLYKLVQKN